VIRNVAPDIPLGQVVLGVLPFVALIVAAIFLICLVPSIVTALPQAVYGVR
jgi:TRAP-type C4-dicarboxylate transport system permease large subunit